MTGWPALPPSRSQGPRLCTPWGAGPQSPAACWVQHSSLRLCGHVWVRVRILLRRQFPRDSGVSHHVSYVPFLYRRWSCCLRGEAAISWLGNVARWSPGIQNWGAPVEVDGGCRGGGKQVLWFFFHEDGRLSLSFQELLSQFFLVRE